jgi:hypothetical protein
VDKGELVFRMPVGAVPGVLHADEKDTGGWKLVGWITGGRASGGWDASGGTLIVGYS